MADKPSVDDLRARLRELGYLDAGVDRFVLGPVRGGRSPLSLAWRSSARIGVLAGLLLGPSAAIALGARLPGLVTGVRDALVLALYFATLFGVAVAVIALGAALLLGTIASRVGDTSRLGGRAHAFSRVAALVVAGGCLVYLVFWWRTVNAAGSVPLGSAWTWGVLIVAVAVSLVLGHAVRVTTLALVARTHGAPATFPRQFRSRWLGVALGIGAFIGAAALLFVVSPRHDQPSRASRSSTPLHVVPTAMSLFVIAIDGLDIEYVERLRQAGRLPALGRLLFGARASLPASDAPDPARTWTSLATGQPASVHGVSGIETRRVTGIEGTVAPGSGGLGETIAAATDLLRLTRPTLTTSLQRRSKTFWEVVAGGGLPIVVVNWWATWPVPEGPGIVLSDRATLRLEVGGGLDAEIAPADLYPSLRAGWAQLRGQARRRVADAFPGNAGDPVFNALRRAAEQDALALELAVRVSTPAPRLAAVYLPGLDIAQFELLRRADSALPASALAARVEALDRYYDFLDGVVAALLRDRAHEGHADASVAPGEARAGAAGKADASPYEAREASRVVALVTDPGRAAAGNAGLLVLSGADVRAGASIQASRNDVVPTLLYALGLPLSRELPGRPRTELFDPAFVARVLVRVVPTYGPRQVAPRPSNATPLDQEMLDRLRSLGYVR